MYKFSILLILLTIHVNGKALTHDYPRLTPDTLSVDIGENIIVLNQNVTNILSYDLSDSYTGRIVTVNVDSRQNKKMVISTINGNYYFIFKAISGEKGVHDFRDENYASFLPVIDFEKQYDKEFNSLVKYNSLTNSQSLSNLKELNYKHPKPNISARKDIKTSLILNKIYEDFQLRYFEYLLVNNSSDDYVVSMLKAYQGNILIHPVDRSYPSIIKAKSTGKLVIVFKKDIGEISISIGSKYYGNLIKTNML